jgi:hypothetical protein
MEFCRDIEISIVAENSESLEPWGHDDVGEGHLVAFEKWAFNEVIDLLDLFV